MKVYVVTSGEYSSYGIECVTDSFDKAVEYVKRRSGGHLYNSYEIENYDTEDLDRYLNDKRSSWAVHKERDNKITARLMTDVRPCDDHNYRWKHVRKAKYDGHIFVCVKAKSKEQAEKIAEDLFTKYEANHSGVA